MNSPIFDSGAMYWGNSVPIWVVSLSHKRGGMKEVRDVKYVRARTQEGAVRTAKAHSTLPLNCSCYARIATPQDLGCTPTQGAPL